MQCIVSVFLYLGEISVSDIYFLSKAYFLCFNFNFDSKNYQIFVKAWPAPCPRGDVTVAVISNDDISNTTWGMIPWVFN